MLNYLSSLFIAFIAMFSIANANDAIGDKELMQLRINEVFNKDDLDKIVSERCSSSENGVECEKTITQADIEREFKYCKYSHNFVEMDSKTPYSCDAYLIIFGNYGKLTSNEALILYKVYKQESAEINKQIALINSQKDKLYDYQDKLNEENSKLEKVNKEKRAAELFLKVHHFTDKMDVYYRTLCKFLPDDIIYLDLESFTALLGGHYDTMLSILRNGKTTFEEAICVNEYKPYREKIVNIKNTFCANQNNPKFNLTKSDSYWKNNTDVGKYYLTLMKFMARNGMVSSFSSDKEFAKVNKLMCSMFSDKVKFLLN